MAYTREDFIQKYGPFIAKTTKGTGIFPGTVVAQAVLESSGGGLVGGSKLSREANNYFGIKCHSTWNGKKYYINTGEWSAEKGNYAVNACFRHYNSVEDSLKDHISFLQTNPRYKQAGVFEAKSVEEQAKALQRAGYATSPTYADKVTSIYNGLKSYIDKYQTYGAKGIIKSFFNSPVAFVKRNPVPVLLVTSVAILTTVLILSKTKK
jgi:flagellum-specific peptidoglycan hydrolase FlgJ